MLIMRCHCVAHRRRGIVSVAHDLSATPTTQVVSVRCVVSDARPFNYVDGAVSLCITQASWGRLGRIGPFGHTHDIGGVIALCGLGCVLPLDYVDGLVSLLGLC
jgi:hypothetical protein